MIASVNLDVSIVNVTNESEAGRRRKGRESRVRKRERERCMYRKNRGGRAEKEDKNEKNSFIFSYC